MRGEVRVPRVERRAERGRSRARDHELRLLFLLWERSVAPFDLSGLASPPDRIARHVLGAHHDGVQVLYDLELLSHHPGWLERLRDGAAEIARGASPRLTRDDDQEPE